MRRNFGVTTTFLSRFWSSNIINFPFTINICWISFSLSLLPTPSLSPLSLFASTQKSTPNSNSENWMAEKRWKLIVFPVCCVPISCIFDKFLFRLGWKKSRMTSFQLGEEEKEEVEFVSSFFSFFLDFVTVTFVSFMAAQRQRRRLVYVDVNGKFVVDGIAASLQFIKITSMSIDVRLMTEGSPSPCDRSSRWRLDTPFKPRAMTTTMLRKQSKKCRHEKLFSFTHTSMRYWL